MGMVLEVEVEAVQVKLRMQGRKIKNQVGYADSPLSLRKWSTSFNSETSANLLNSALNCQMAILTGRVLANF